MKTLIFCGSLSFTMLCMFSPSRADTLRTVMLRGDAAPSTETDTIFILAGSPSLNNNGQTAFLGVLAGPSVNATNDRGIWSEKSGTVLTLIAREGSAAPGTGSGVIFRDISTTPPVLSDNEQVAFISYLSGTGVRNHNDSGIWSEDGGSGLALTARGGDPAPGAGTGVFYEPVTVTPLMNANGDTQFFAGLDGTGVNLSNDVGIWSEDGGSLAILARAGNAAPGTGSGVNFSDFKGHGALNNIGQSALTGKLTGTGVDSTNDTGIWSEGGGGGLALVVRGGDPAPGTEAGVNFRDFLHGPQLNDNGHTMFTGRLTGTGVDSTNDRGIWSEGNGNGLALVARAGNAAPDTELGVNFSTLAHPVLNGNGNTAFWASLIGPGVDSTNRIGIWSEGAGNGLELVAREGDAAPGTEIGVNFNAFDPPTINGVGQTAFEATLTGVGVDSTNNSGLWAEDYSGNLRLIAREGSTLDVDDGPGIDMRTVAAIGFIRNAGNEDGRASGFNDLGQIAFIATFTDNTAGVFVSNLAAVPEPGTILLGAMAGIGLLLCKRRSTNRTNY